MKPVRNPLDSSTGRFNGIANRLPPPETWAHDEIWTLWDYPVHAPAEFLFKPAYGNASYRLHQWIWMKITAILGRPHREYLQGFRLFQFRQTSGFDLTGATAIVRGPLPREHELRRIATVVQFDYQPGQRIAINTILVPGINGENRMAENDFIARTTIWLRQKLMEEGGCRPWPDQHGIRIHANRSWFRKPAPNGCKEKFRAATCNGTVEITDCYRFAKMLRTGLGKKSWLGFGMVQTGPRG